MKLVVVPLSIIRRRIDRIIKNSLTIHLIFLKIALIIGAIFKNELTVSMLHTVHCCSFISSSILVGLNCENQIVMIFLHHELRRWQL